MKGLPLNRGLLVLGQPGTGKSYWVKKHLQKVQNVFIYDMMHEYGEYGQIVHSVAAARAAFADGARRVVYQPLDDPDAEFEPVCEFVYRCLRNVVFVVDEVHNFVSSGMIGKWFRKLVREGRKYGIGVWALSQRASNLHWDLKGLSVLVVIFRLLRFDADSIADKFARELSPEEIENLPDRHHILFRVLAEAGGKISRCGPV